MLPLRLTDRSTWPTAMSIAVWRSFRQTETFCLTGDTTVLSRMNSIHHTVLHSTAKDVFMWRTELTPVFRSLVQTESFSISGKASTSGDHGPFAWARTDSCTLWTVAI